MFLFRMAAKIDAAHTHTLLAVWIYLSICQTQTNKQIQANSLVAVAQFELLAFADACVAHARAQEVAPKVDTQM